MFLVHYVEKKPWQEKLGLAAEASVEHALVRWFKSGYAFFLVSIRWSLLRYAVRAPVKRYRNLPSWKAGGVFLVVAGAGCSDFSCTRCM